MTDRLSEIEQQAHESSIDSIGPADVAWLIAEVKRLRIIEQYAKDAVSRWHEWEHNPSVDYESYMDWLAEALQGDQRTSPSPQ